MHPQCGQEVVPFMSIEDNDRVSEVLIDVSNVQTAEQLHSLLKERLEFPEYYGMNWDAFWDVITGAVELPEKLIFTGWSQLQSILPKEAQQLHNQLRQLNEKFPSWGCDTEYK